MVQRLLSGGGSILSTIKAGCINRFSAYPLIYLNIRMASSSTGMDLTEFSKVLSKASKITVLTGAGISAESGIPTFRGAGGLWRTWSAMELATPEAFAADPSLVWEFYHYRRCVVANAAPNRGHYALSILQKRCENEGKNFTLITQNIDELHWKAGSKDIVELHGSLWKTRCCRCNDVEENYENPICPALDGKGAPNSDARDAQIPVSELPHCKKCNALLRPHVVWFGECLDHAVLDKAENALINCDLFLVVGTSAVVQPAAGFAPIVQGGGGVVAEFNLEDTPITRACSNLFLITDEAQHCSRGCFRSIVIVILVTHKLQLYMNEKKSGLALILVFESWKSTCYV
ncbi:uncharacterized protein LOC131047986 isoform X2 [Cryptomeria japonica]|uniref:uncharacterized protein LOC131047986 isoform X2 n=1 Tax=Cryptomeria japonica TaxID=3369 RepID=UPI0027DA60A3|nr:uncharacterized protein LOC131047986 isoform X2 [Cryptomeria japonica]